MKYLSMHFRVESDWEVFQMSHAYLYPAVTDAQATWFLEQTFRDCANGGGLPPFVLAAYHVLKYGR